MYLVVSLNIMHPILEKFATCIDDFVTIFWLWIVGITAVCSHRLFCWLSLTLISLTKLTLLLLLLWWWFVALLFMGPPAIVIVVFSGFANCQTDWLYVDILKTKLTDIWWMYLIICCFAYAFLSLPRTYFSSYKVMLWMKSPNCCSWC